MAKKKVLSEEDQSVGTVKFSVYLPLDTHREWTTKLASQGRKQNPTVVAWIEEYVHGKREAPEIVTGLKANERDLFSQLLDLYRKDKISRALLESWVKTRK